MTHIARRMGRSITGYATPALERIFEYAWPGNIRELENVVERACALATGPLIDVCDLPDELRSRRSPIVASTGIRPLCEVEREYIPAALQRNGGNKTHTAAQLRINATTLFRKLWRYAAAQPSCEMPRLDVDL